MHLSAYHIVAIGNNVWEEYCVIAAFKGESPSQISAESGDQVILLNKDPSGKRMNGWIDGENNYVLSW